MNLRAPGLISRIVLIVFSILSLLSISFPIPASAAVPAGYPRKANYFLKWKITAAEVKELAKWDVVIVDMENQITNPARLQELRALNPNIILLAYITSEEIRTDAVNGPSTMRDRLARGIPESWYLVNAEGQRYSFWPGTHMLNVTNHAPQSQGLTFNKYLSNFVVDQVLGTGLWDGVFYDNAWIDLTWFTGQNVDFNADGFSDVNIDAKWYEGMKKLYEYTRERAQPGTIIIGNGHTSGYVDALNGKMIENFGVHSWIDVMRTYKANQLSPFNPVINILNANAGNTNNPESYQAMRFGLASTLMENGYYSFDFGDQNHGQTWWYDEYAVALGNPLGPASSAGGETKYAKNVWSRNFENGITVVNSTDETKTITLGGEYEKIHGTQDPITNDGSIVSEVTLAPKDGLILMKTFETLKDVLFTNGFFARFFRPDGSRARNGLFVYEETQKGGAEVAHFDLDQNGERDLVVVSGNRIQAWRDDDQLLMKVYPYGANYTGKLRVAIGDLDNNGQYEIYVAPSPGFKFPIMAYSMYGETTRTDFYPFGTKYSGGYHLALTSATEKIPARLVIGSGKGMRPTVALYGDNLKKIRSFAAFENAFIGGVAVAAGDVDGDGVEDLVVSKSEAGKPQVRVFSLEGKEKYKTFDAYSTVFKPGIDVRTIDTDFDGVDEIMTLSEGAL